MANVVFWSWQSDLDERVTRHLVRDALADAIDTLAANLEEAERPSLTHDTKDVAGTPDIVATILEKIDEAAVFVADITPIAMSDQGKAIANPNVLIELGYAKKSLGAGRMILVWNTAFQGTSPEQLPFDLRGRRAPLAYRLEIGADRKALASARAELAGQLVARIKACLGTLPGLLPAQIPWALANQSDPATWFEAGKIQTITNPEYGSKRIQLRESQGRGYARLIPSSWEPVPDAQKRLLSDVGLPALAGRVRSLSWGLSRGGIAVYRPSNRSEEVMDIGALTQWFSATGEIWGVANEYFFEEPGGRRALATRYIVKHWSYFLGRNAHLAQSIGGRPPFNVKVGVTRLDDTWWPVQSIFPDEERFGAVEDQYEFTGLLGSTENVDVFAVVAEAFNGLAALFGIRPWTLEKIATVAGEGD